MSLELDALPLDSEGGAWVCPATGYEVAKDRPRNLIQRSLVLRGASGDRDVREKYLGLCRDSILVWVNLFCWTYNVRTVDEEGKTRTASDNHVPFITWPCQDIAIDEIVDCIDSGDDIIVDKSRDMGASWIAGPLVSSWYWLFREDTHSLLVSRIEDLVDKIGDPDSLFWKIDYLLERLPGWMLPCEYRLLSRDAKKHRTHLSLVNPSNGSTIRGTATTGHVGRAGRRTFILLDEMAAMQNGAEVWRSSGDTSSCRVGNSTPLGPGTEYTRQFFKALEGDTPRLVRLLYQNHPDKGRGRELRVDDDGSVTGTVGREYWWSPWFELERKRRDLQDLATNVLADHVASGDSFFSAVMVSQHRSRHARQAVRCALTYDGEGIARLVPTPGGMWHVWSVLEDGRIPERWEQRHVGFCDLSQGAGSSNSVCAWMNADTGEVVAELVTPHLSPHEFAKEVCPAGRDVFGVGDMPALLGWERNGPGVGFYQDVMDQDYPFVFFERAIGAKVERRGKMYGWQSTRQTKRALLAGLARAMHEREIIIHSGDGLAEMTTYVFLDDGSIAPGTQADLTSGARESHGDRVIAYAGCVYIAKELPRVMPSDVPMFKPGTFGYELEHEDLIRRGVG